MGMGHITQNGFGKHKQSYTLLWGKWHRWKGTLDPAIFIYNSSLFLLTQHYWCQGQIKPWMKDIHLKDKNKVLPADREQHMLEHFSHCEVNHSPNPEFRSAPGFLSHTKLTHPPAMLPLMFNWMKNPSCTNLSDFNCVMTWVLFLISFGYESISQIVGGFCPQDFYPAVA